MGVNSGASSQGSKGNALIIVVALVVFGLVFGGFGYVKLKVSRESAAWPTVEGRVSQARLDTTRSDGTTKYAPRLSYTYAVGGVRYTGHDVSAVTSYTSRARADEVLRRYPSGATVSVHYDPEKPSAAVLEPGGSGSAFFIMVAGVACFLLAGAVVVSVLRR